MRLKKDSTEQKLRGAYYTPLQLADAMVSLFASENIRSVLEPSCGDGVFLDALKDNDLIDRIPFVQAVEIDPNEASKVKSNYSDMQNVDVCQEDFFDFFKRIQENTTYDMIFGNPPYIRYQYLKETCFRKTQREQ